MIKQASNNARIVSASVPTIAMLLPSQLQELCVKKVPLMFGATRST
jgi:hypothetical protein